MVAGQSGRIFHNVRRLVVEASSYRKDRVLLHLILVVELLVLVVIIELCCVMKAVVQVCTRVCA